LGASSLSDMPGGDSASRTRGRIERRGDALRVRVYAGDDPVTGKRVYRSETVPGTDRAAQRRAEKTHSRLLAEVDKQRAPTSTVTLTYVLDEWLRSSGPRRGSTRPGRTRRGDGGRTSWPGQHHRRAALDWARLPAGGGDSNWWAYRLSAVRGFATYLHALDPAHEVLP